MASIKRKLGLKRSNHVAGGLLTAFLRSGEEARLESPFSSSPRKSAGFSPPVWSVAPAFSSIESSGARRNMGRSSPRAFFDARSADPEVAKGLSRKAEFPLLPDRVVSFVLRAALAGEPVDASSFGDGIVRGYAENGGG